MYVTSGVGKAARPRVVKPRPCNWGCLHVRHLSFGCTLLAALERRGRRRAVWKLGVPGTRWRRGSATEARGKARCKARCEVARHLGILVLRIVLEPVVKNGQPRVGIPRGGIRLVSRLGKRLLETIVKVGRARVLALLVLDCACQVPVVRGIGFRFDGCLPRSRIGCLDELVAVLLG